MVALSLRRAITHTYGLGWASHRLLLQFLLSVQSCSSRTPLNDGDRLYCPARLARRAHWREMLHDCYLSTSSLEKREQVYLTASLHFLLSYFFFALYTQKDSLATLHWLCQEKQREHNNDPALVICFVFSADVVVLNINDTKPAAQLSKIL